MRIRNFTIVYFYSVFELSTNYFYKSHIKFYSQLSQLHHKYKFTIKVLEILYLYLFVLLTLRGVQVGVIITLFIF